jgi:putative membrane protein insertion efficiency factor
MKTSWSTRVGVTIVRSYQLLLAPFAGGACRFEPTCSEYAIDAIHTHGLARGVWLALRRVARCHPLARPGIDPVPPRTDRSVPHLHN